MPLLHDPDFFVLHRDLKHCDQVVFGELSEDRPADQVGKSLSTPQEVLFRLNDRQLIASTFCLHRKDELPARAVDGNIYLVHLYLADVLDRRAQVVLKRIRRYAQENIDQSVVSNLRQKRLLVRHGMSRYDFRRGVWNLDRH